MADPQLANAMRIQAIFSHNSGLPEDNSINSFAALYEPTAFADFEAASDAITLALRDFYSVQHATNSIAYYLSPALTTLTFKTYELALAPPRFPYIPSTALALTKTGDGLPEEVAFCISWVASQNSPRYRGRSYIGPLHASAMQSTGGVYGQPAAQFIIDMEGAGSFLNGFELATDDFTFCIISQVDAAIRPITGGWVDNAFDSQRRRGVAPTSRTTFGTYLGS